MPRRVASGMLGKIVKINTGEIHNEFIEDSLEEYPEDNQGEPFKMLESKSLKKCRWNSVE